MEKYQYIIVPIMTLILCQFLKFIIESIKNKKIIWSRLFNGSGGMPSSHTSFCFSITTLLGLNLGFDSPLFGLAMVFSGIIAYDSMGLRFESGLQASAINILSDKVLEKDSFKRLKEQLGHKPLEVLIGILFGILMAVLYKYMI